MLIDNANLSIKHFLRSKDIDPLFCDVDYNIAVHHIKYTFDYGQAVSMLKNNLKCIYSNMKSFRSYVHY